MSTYDQYQFSSYLNEDRLDSNESNELNASDLSKNPNDPEIEYIESNSNLPEQSISHNNGVTVIANSLGKKILKKKVFTQSKRSRPNKSWVWHYFRQSKPDKKAYCKVKIMQDGNKVVCGHNYELTTGTGNLKAYLRQVHRILPPEENNKNVQLTNIVSNQPSLYDFINKKRPYHLLNKKKL
ncbi:4885_t:CDS:1 [Dentiscutata erythropus]|uniref:4885_t:CDS:1 n=1 Tax=Dentiscutata erythropus TaxID=1348616 RepID=A0A9N9ET92_9GLOM|nr:4885_t:CDS:1 [Dentiscutata erythropus]